MKGRNNTIGSFTLEAAIVLPIFFCIGFMLAYFIRVIYIRETVRHTLYETAWQFAQVGYLADLSDKRDKKEEVSITNIIDEIFNSNILTNQEALNKNIVEFIVETGRKKLEEVAFIPVIKSIFCFNSPSNDIFDRIGIKNGLSGIDFSGSEFMYDDEKNILLVANYTLNLPFYPDIFPDINQEERVRIKAWTGDGTSGFIDNDESINSIWNMDNFTRGNLISEAFGRNMPDNFPVIAVFENGIATMIKSIDFTANSYADSENKLKKTVFAYIDELIAFNGVEKSWAGTGVTLPVASIEKKRLLLVIPGNEMPLEIQAAMEACALHASMAGIDFELVIYGLKPE